MLLKINKALKTKNLSASLFKNRLATYAQKTVYISETRNYNKAESRP